MDPLSLQIVDTGLRSGLENHALDRAWLRGCAAVRRGPTLRFYQSLPTASLGRFQAAPRELRLEVCARRGLEVARRMTGGGALYLDPQQVGFSLVAPESALPGSFCLSSMLASTAAALAQALASLGIAVQTKPPNDLEIDGRKLASVFAIREGGTWLAHATVLLDVGVRAMLEVLRVPTEKLSPDGLAAARDRLTTLAEQPGGTPPLPALQRAIAEAIAEAFCWRPTSPSEPYPVKVSPALLAHERRTVRLVDWPEPGPGVIEVLAKAGSSTLRLQAEADARTCVFGEVRLAADLHAQPGEALAQLAACLRGRPLEDGVARAARLIEEGAVEVPGLAVEDLTRLARLALDTRRLQNAASLSHAEANAVMIHSPDGSSAEGILRRATVMLVPYCAKPVWCKWRHRDGCPECGKCEVGDAYRMGRERGMRVVTITKYEHLVETLGELQREGAAYVGMCCSHFYLKRHRAFTEAGLPAVLMDISGSNCYELQQEAAAYQGRFQAQARLDASLLAKVMRFVPPRRRSGEPSAGADL
jgi:lipoate-protein ligase A